MYVCMTRRENAFPSFPARASDFHVSRFTLHVTKSIVTCKVKKHELRASGLETQLPCLACMQASEKRLSPLRRIKRASAGLELTVGDNQ